MKKQIVITALMIGLLVASGLFAQTGIETETAEETFQTPQTPPPPERPGLERDIRSRLRRSGRPFSFLKLAFLRSHQDEIGISDEQIDRVKELTFELEELRINQKHKTAENRLELKKLMSREKRDYTRIEILMNETAKRRNQALVEGMKIREQIKEVFTPEQMEDLRRAARRELPRRLPRLRYRNIR